jgi:hypothetical protein
MRLRVLGKAKPFEESMLEEFCLDKKFRYERTSGHLSRDTKITTRLLFRAVNNFFLCFEAWVTIGD